MHPFMCMQVPTAVSSLNDDATLLTHDLFTNDVLYAEVRLGGVEEGAGVT